MLCDRRLNPAALEALAERLDTAVQEGHLRAGTAMQLLGQATFDACGCDIATPMSRSPNARLLQAVVRRAGTDGA